MSSTAAQKESTTASIAHYDIMGQSNALIAIGCRASWSRNWQPHKTTAGIYAEEAEKETGRDGRGRRDRSSADQLAPVGEIPAKVPRIPTRPIDSSIDPMVVWDSQLFVSSLFNP